MYIGRQDNNSIAGNAEKHNFSLVNWNPLTKITKIMMR